jgi:hypothetical protein
VPKKNQKKQQKKKSMAKMAMIHARPYGRATEEPIMFGKKRTRPSGRKGTMVLEMLMVIPLLGLIVVLIFFWGWAMVNQQSVRVSDRYAAWENADSLGTSNIAINQDFMGNTAVNVALLPNGGQSQTVQDFATQTRDNYGPAAGNVADDLITHAPGGCQDFVSAEFPSDVALMQKFQGPIKDTYGREGVEWRRIQLNEVPTIQKLYLTQDGGVDTTLNSIGGQGAGMAQMIRGLYLNGW